MLLGVIGDKVLEGACYILLIIDSFVYGCVNKIYKVYMALAGARIFSSELFSAVANRVYAVVGIVMLFVLAYSLIQGIISPDKITKGPASGADIVKRVLKAVIGLALVPAAFNLAYRGQEAILSNDVIGKIFLGFDDKANVINHSAITIDGEETVPAGSINQNEGIKTQAGTITALSIWQAFFYPTDSDSEESSKEAAKTIEAKEAPIFIKGASMLSKFACGLAIASVIFSGPLGILGAATVCGSAAVIDSAENVLGKVTTLEQAYGAAAGSGNFSYFPAFAQNVVNGEIQYVFLLSTIAGIVCIYLFISFAIDMAVRAAKLAFLELIAPIPLMMQILPDSKSQKSFDIWLGNCLKLFFQVFIRLAMVYIIVYLIAHLGSILKSVTTESIDNDFIATVVLKVVLIFGLLIFAKEAPSFITSSLGMDANITGGLGIRSKLDKGGVFAVGAAAGSIGANILSGTGRGFNNARKQLTNDNGNSKIRRLGGALGYIAASPFMGLGQGVRSTGRAIFESRGAHAPHDVREMVNMINDNHTSTRSRMEARRQKKEEKQKDIENRAGVEDDDNILQRGAKRAGAKLNYTSDRVASALRNFTGIPRDTTYYTEQLKLASDMTALGKDLEATVAGNEKVKIAARNVARANSQETLSNLKQKVAQDKGMTVEQVESDANLMANIYSEQDKLIKQAEEKEKIAKADAIRDQLVQGAAGMSNDTTTKLQQFMDDHHDLISKHAKDKVSGNQTLEEKYRDLFGMDVFSGYFDFDKAVQVGNSSLDINLKGVSPLGETKEKTVRLRTVTNSSGKEERKYLYTDESGVEKSASTLKEAMDGLGIRKAETVGSRSLGVADKKDTLSENILDTIKNNGGGKLKIGSSGGEIEVKTDGTYVAPDGTVLNNRDDLKSFMAGKQIEVSKSYLDAVNKLANNGDWEVQLDVSGVQKTIRYDSSSAKYVISELGAKPKEFTTLDSLASDDGIAEGTVKSNTLFKGEKSSLASDLKEKGQQDQTYVLSSSDYREAMQNKQTNTGGGKK